MRLLIIAILLCPGMAFAGDYELREALTYAQRSSGDLQGDLYLPEGRSNPPAVVMIHGGGWVGGERADMDRFAEEVAEAGYAVFNISYRLAPEHRFPAAAIDARDAVRWLRANADELGIDGNRIAAWGYSAGAHLALLLGLLPAEPLPGEPTSETRPTVRAVISGAGPTNLREYPDNKYVTQFMPEDADDALYRLASPVALVSADDPPVFMYHGKRDMVVVYRNSEKLSKALTEKNVTHELVTLPFGHVVSYFADGKAMRAALDFLDRFLTP